MSEAKTVEKIVPAYGWLAGLQGRRPAPRPLGGARGQGDAGAAGNSLRAPGGTAADLRPLRLDRAGVVYALFGTSRHMPVGPPVLMALLTFAGVSALAEPGTEEYVSLALLLALLAGTLQLAIGLLRMSFVANFIPQPVLSGFIYASAVLIALSQARHLLGYRFLRSTRRWSLRSRSPGGSARRASSPS